MSLLLLFGGPSIPVTPPITVGNLTVTAAARTSLTVSHYPRTELDVNDAALTAV